MFCRHCGNELLDKAVVCSGCGEAVEDFSTAQPVEGQGWNWPVFLALLALAFSGVPGIVFGVMGLSDPGKKAQGAALISIGVLMSLFWAAALWGV